MKKCIYFMLAFFFFTKEAPSQENINNHLTVSEDFLKNNDRENYEYSYEMLDDSTKTRISKNIWWKLMKKMKSNFQPWPKEIEFLKKEDSSRENFRILIYNKDENFYYTGTIVPKKNILKTVRYSLYTSDYLATEEVKMTRDQNGTWKIIDYTIN